MLRKCALGGGSAMRAPLRHSCRLPRPHRLRGRGGLSPPAAIACRSWPRRTLIACRSRTPAP